MKLETYPEPPEPEVPQEVPAALDGFLQALEGIASAASREGKKAAAIFKQARAPPMPAGPPEPADLDLELVSSLEKLEKELLEARQTEDQLRRDLAVARRDLKKASSAEDLKREQLETAEQKIEELHAQSEERGGTAVGAC